MKKRTGHTPSAIGKARIDARLCVLCWSDIVWDADTHHWRHADREPREHPAAPPLLGPVAKP